MESKGEMIIRSILEEEGVFFRQEYSFSDCKSFKGKPLRFDFAIFKDGKVEFLCEVDGRQHFEYVEFFSKNKQKWKYQREMDVQKNSYALAHGIPLYRIPFNRIEELKTIEDIKNDEFLVKNRFHNYLNNPLRGK